jgi:hypothetical protein
MICLAQLSWLVRAAAHKELASYIKGLGGAFILAPAMIKERAEICRHWNNSAGLLWQKILHSESLARRDYTLSPAEPASLFLKWYFRLF